MKKNPCGYTMVFGGADFQPEEFLQTSKLARTDYRVGHRGNALSDGRIAEESWIEFDDIHEGTYPLDPAYEALFILSSQEDEFFRLSRFPGVDIRTLNIFGGALTCSINLEPADIALLHKLLIQLDILVLDPE